jgi:hypothetical protein
MCNCPIMASPFAPSYLYIRLHAIRRSSRSPNPSRSTLKKLIHCWRELKRPGLSKLASPAALPYAATAQGVDAHSLQGNASDVKRAKLTGMAMVALAEESWRIAETAG